MVSEHRGRGFCFRVFQGKDTRQVHATSGRKPKPTTWYFEPCSYEMDVLWSDGYATKGEARYAAHMDVAWSRREGSDRYRRSS